MYLCVCVYLILLLLLLLYYYCTVVFKCGSEQEKNMDVNALLKIIRLILGYTRIVPDGVYIFILMI